MKQIFLILAVLFISINLYSAPPDSCLWAPIPEHLNSTFNDEGRFNQDSTLYIDTCGLYLLDPNIYKDSSGNHTQFPDLNSNQFFKQHKRYYSKSIWDIQFYLPNLAFDTTNKDLNTLYYFTVDDLDSNNTDIFNGFQKANTKFGNIKFWLSRFTNLTISETLNSYYVPDFCIVETENLINSIEFEEFIESIIPNIYCRFGSEIIYPLTVNTNVDVDLKIRISPDYDLIEIESSDVIRNVMVYSVAGSCLIDLKNNNNTKTNLQVNIGHLLTGLYFIKINDNFHKFMVVR